MVASETSETIDHVGSPKQNPAARADARSRAKRRRAASGHLIGYARVSTDDQSLAFTLGGPCWPRPPAIPALA